MSGRNGRPTTSSRFRVTTAPKGVAFQEEDEEDMDKTLKEAGVFEHNMTPDQKKQIVAVLNDSKRQAEEDAKGRKQLHKHRKETELDAEIPQSAIAGEPKHVKNSDSVLPSQPLSPTTKLSPQPSPSTVISEGTSSDSNDSFRPCLSHFPELSVTKVRVGQNTKEEKISSAQHDSSSNLCAQTPVSEGHHVGSNSNERKIVKWFATTCEAVGAEKDGERPDMLEFEQEAQAALKKKMGDDSSDKTSDEELQKSSTEVNSASEQYVNPADSSSKAAVTKECVSQNQEELDISSTSDNDAITLTHSCIIKTQQGSIHFDVSPVEDTVKQKTVESYPPHLRGLEMFRGDKTKWLAEAKKASKALRVTYWRDLQAKNPVWKHSITETGNNLKTLFKGQTFSGLFNKHSGPFPGKQKGADTSVDSMANSVWQSSRSTKSPQMPREDYHSLNQHEEKDDHSNKLPQQSSVPQTLQDSESNVAGRRSVRPDKKLKYLEHDADAGSAPSSPSSTNADPYEFNDKSDADSDWKVQANTKNKRNNRKGGRLNNDDNVDTQGRQLRGHRAAAKKSKGARVTQGAISRPSDHVHRTNSDTKNSVEESLDVLALNDNQANNTKSVWLNKENAQRENLNPGLLPSGFYPVRKSCRRPERNQHIPTQNNKITEDTEHAVVGRTVVACPICNNQFYEDEIQEHASGCQEFQTSAEGDVQQDGLGSGGDNIKALKVSHKSAPGSKPTSPSTGDNSTLEQCKVCLEQFCSGESTSHMEQCLSINAQPLTGQKRGNTEDEGPAKKTTRRLSLNKKQ